MLPVCPPGFVSVTVVKPGGAPVGTIKVALLPVAVTTWAGTPPTVILTFWAPKPMPVIVTCSPTPAHEGVMLSMWPAWAAAIRAEASSPMAKVMAITRDRAKPGVEVGFLPIFSSYQQAVAQQHDLDRSEPAHTMWVPSAKKCGRAITPWPGRSI